MKRKRLMLALAFALGAAACHAPSKDPGEGESVTEIPEPEDALSEPLMIALSQAKNFHHKADVYLKQGEIQKATDAVKSIIDIPFPEGSPEGADVKLDARARLGKLLLRQERLDEAEEVVAAGIEAAGRGSFFLANLHNVRGQILAARADRLAEEEDDEEAADAMREDAIRSYNRSIEINEELLKELPKEPPR